MAWRWSNKSVNILSDGYNVKSDERSGLSNGVDGRSSSNGPHSLSMTFNSGPPVSASSPLSGGGQGSSPLSGEGLASSPLSNQTSSTLGSSSQVSANNNGLQVHLFQYFEGMAGGDLTEKLRMLKR